MCGRFILADDKDIEEINRILREINSRHNGTGMTAKTGEIYPTNNAAVLSLIDKKPSLSVMKWGFPKWDSKGVIINAKAETAAEKKMFAKPLIEKRCVILSSGFFEWDKKDEKKDKYLFTMNDSNMLYMAGIYNAYKIEDALVEHFVILTRNANRCINDIHDRMPVILHKNELTSWLKDDKFITEAFRRDDIVLERMLA